MVTVKETLDNLRADFNRAALLQGRAHGLLNKLYVLIQPGFVVVLCYRLSRFCHYNKLGFMCRLFDAIMFFYATTEISPIADMGPGLVFDGKLFGIPSAVTIGKNCTFLGLNTLTLGAMENFSVDRDKIVIGDYCTFGPASRIIRPVVLASGTQVMPNSLVMLNESNLGASVSGIPAKRRRVDALEAIKNWNPLVGKKMNVGESI